MAPGVSAIDLIDELIRFGGPTAARMASIFASIRSSPSLDWGEPT
jgi:hypothetical protein